IVQVEKLKPATAYKYAVYIDGQPVPRWTQWQFRTFPTEDSRASVRITFGGCAMYAPVNERMWDTVATRQADAFLLTGDNVYLVCRLLLEKKKLSIADV